MYSLKTQSENRQKTQSENRQKTNIREIEKEYSIKRCNFNPLSPSPNKFIKNLEVRMRMYYKDLYKSYK